MSQDEQNWQNFVEAAFNAAGLPEVTEDQLELGTYTNAQIAARYCGEPHKLLSLLMTVSNLGENQASKRSVLSFMVDMNSEQTEQQKLNN